MSVKALIALLALAPAQQPTNYADAWKQAEGAVRARYYDREERKDRMDALLAKYGPIASQAKSLGEFRSAMLGMIDEFGDSHFDFLTAADQGFYTLTELAPGGKALKMPHIGAWFAESPLGYKAQMVLEGTSAAEAGLRKGDVVLRVNGRPFNPIDALKPLVSRHATFSVLREGTDMELRMKVDESDGLDLFLRASKDSARVIERDGKKFGYFHLWTMATDRFRDALSAFVYGRAAQTDGFILDLRDGFGGRPEGFADPFFRPEARIEWSVGGTSFSQQFGYQRPLVVLVNDGSRSAKEVLAFILKKSKRAALVGQPTGGRVLGTSPLRLGDWAIFEIPMVDLAVDDVRLENNGVDPDFLVLDEFSPEGKDMFIERALDLLSQSH